MNTMTSVYSYLRRYINGRQLVIGIPYLWFVVLALIPLLIILKISLSEMETTEVSDMVSLSGGWLTIKFNFSNYAFLATDPLYFETFLSSIKYALITTVVCLIIAYPFAYFLARSPTHLQPMLLMLIMLPFWTSFLIRIYAWKTLLVSDGVFRYIHVIRDY